MKLPEGKIELAVSQDKSLDPTLQSVYLNVEDKTLVAMNGYVMAIVPVEIDSNDLSGLVSLDTLKAARKAFADKANRDCIPAIICNGVAKIAAPGAPEFPRPEGQFPNYTQVAFDCINRCGGEHTVSLDVNLLRNLALALGPELGKPGHKTLQVTLTVNDKTRSVLVRNMNNPAATGIIMPMRVR